MEYSYYKIDPTGNITAIVETLINSLAGNTITHMKTHSTISSFNRLKFIK